MIDIFLVLIFFLAIWSGWKKGFIVGSLGLLTWIGSLITALILYPYAANLLNKIFPALGVWLFPIAFLTIILSAGILFSWITRSIIRSTPLEAHTHGANRFFGILPGAVNGIIWGTIISALLLTLPISNGLSSNTRDSKLAGRLATEASWLEDKMAPVFDKAFRQAVTRLTIRPETDETVDLEFTVANPQVREDLETKMLEMVNEERAKHGLNALKPDPEMTRVARKHSRDMFARGYFSHINPEGHSPFDRMHSERVKFLVAGENLALAQTLHQAHIGLMNSPGHRANILNRSFGRLGIGVLDGGIHGIMITQNFRN